MVPAAIVCGSMRPVLRWVYPQGSSRSMARSPTFSAMGRRFRRSVAVTLWAGRHYAWVQTRLDAHFGRARVTRRLLSSNFPSASWVTAIRPARVRGNRESPQNGEKGRQSRHASRHTSSAETPMVIEGFGRYHWSACRGQGRRRSVDLRFFRPALYRLSYLTGRPIPTDPAGGNDGI